MTYVNPQFVAGTIRNPDAEDRTKSFRLDLEYKIGSHDIRFGVDENRLRSANAGEITAGGPSWNYRYAQPPTDPTVTTIALTGYAVPIAGIGGTPALRNYYVFSNFFSDVTNAQSNQSAEFIEDSWRVTKNVLLKLGVRNESFENKNGDGQTFLKSDNFVSPRFATSWDVNGDSSLKLFGSAGRYSLQIPTHVAVRGASRSSYLRQYYNYTGVDPVTGIPTGLTPLTPLLSPDNEFGQLKDSRTVSAQDIKPTYQDELTVGMEKALLRTVNAGVKFTYRKLRSTIDDGCDETPFDNYAAAHNIDTSNYGGFNCASFNPGEANKFLVDYAGTGQNLTSVNLSAADMGYPKAQRTYLALDFFLEHAFADRWYGKINYTFSHSRGNTEGQTRSDNAQTDVAATETWDFPVIMENSYGNLPNDRTHQIKAYGFFQATPEWGVGVNGLASSGRPRNCFGNYAGSNPAGDPGYGAVYFFCDGVATPRGSVGRLPWEIRMDANLSYKPDLLKGLELRADVFNVLNRQTILVVDETREVAGQPTNISPTYGQVLNYSAPRRVRLTAEYNKQF